MGKLRLLRPQKPSGNAGSSSLLRSSNLKKILLFGAYCPSRPAADELRQPSRAMRIFVLVSSTLTCHVVPASYSSYTKSTQSRTTSYLIPIIPARKLPYAHRKPFRNNRHVKVMSPRCKKKQKAQADSGWDRPYENPKIFLSSAAKSSIG